MRCRKEKNDSLREATAGMMGKGGKKAHALRRLSSKNKRGNDEKQPPGRRTLKGNRHQVIPLKKW